MGKLIYFFTIILFLGGCYKTEENIYLDTSYSQTDNYSYSTHHKKRVSSKKSYKYKQKPYKVLGRWYYPITPRIGDTFTGISSWYGPNFHGKLTASGEIYNMYAYTGANKILPLGTKIRVTNLNNNKSVNVKINDRGPFVKGRILDLSYIAGKKLGLDKTGTAPVRIVVLSLPYKTTKNYKKNSKKTRKNGKIKIQIGAFKNLSGATIFKTEYEKEYRKKTYIKKIDNKYKVFIGNFNSYEEAKNFKNRYNIKGFIIQ
jgi:rare lipoprotein A